MGAVTAIGGRPPAALSAAAAASVSSGACSLVVQ